VGNGSPSWAEPDGGRAGLVWKVDMALRDARADVGVLRWGAGVRLTQWVTSAARGRHRGGVGAAMSLGASAGA
jgi:hypothetical protein